MSIQYFDPDEWETVTTFGGSGPTSWGSIGQKRRAPDEIARIKADKQRAEEADILRRADAIRARVYQG